MTDEKFRERMKILLGEEYGDFIAAVENGEAVRAVRVNTLKCSLPDFLRRGALDMTPLSYAEDGFIPKDSEGIGNTPEHHSGMIYVQDPGAMATLTALEVKEGWRVLDSCAAPGGKSGQAAARISNSGFLFSNEYVPKRAKTVVSNFERLGIKNAIVTSLDTAELKKLYSAFFDLVIADVPCSGEGMFRKSDEALADWSEENVISSAKRQSEILENLAPLVRDGGYLLYSTCTYSQEENEMQVDAFLEKHPDYALVPVREELARVTRDGVSFKGAFSSELHLCRRFYPHTSPGEGQFIALMQRRTEDTEGILYKDAAKPLTKDEALAIKRFFDSSLTKIPDGRLAKVGENIVIISHGYPIPERSVFSAGVLLGRVEKGNLFPSHQFFSAYGTLFKRREVLMAGDERIKKYLRGEEIDASFEEGGFCAVFYEDAPLGGGKASGGKIKNHYPKGLRIK